mgnify:CR=1 FL=1
MFERHALRIGPSRSLTRKPKGLWAEPWMVWRENAWRELTCPACRETGLMPKRIDANPPYKPRERYNLFQCENCGTLHYPDAEVFEYESRKDADLARKFYLEVGAGLDAMIAPLAWAGMDRVGSYLEVGGGYGFSVDFASRELGWSAANIDPSFLARTGAADLGHDHVAAYLTPDHRLADQSFDRVLSSEVIEHVKTPEPFLESLTAALSPEGVLLLTTPNAAVVTSDASLDQLLPVITAGHHLVIYSRTGLEAVLRRAGYEHIDIEESGPTLQAAASRQPFTADFSARPDRARLQSYLADRLDALGGDHALFAAFAVRLLKEYVHTAQWDEARAIRDRLARRWMEDYGLDLNLPDSLKPEFVRSEKGERRRLRKFAANHPFSLAIALYYSGRVDQQLGQTREAADAFRGAARIARVLQTVFGAMYAACRETEDAGLRGQMAAAELTANRDPARAAQSLLAIAADVAGLARDEWQRIACQAYAAGALSGQHDEVSRLEPFVRGWIAARSSLSANEGYAAGGLGERALLENDRRAAADWFTRAASAMTDTSEKAVFSAKAAKARGIEEEPGTVLIRELNAGNHALTRQPAEILREKAPADPAISQPVAYALGIYHLNVDPDAARAMKWFSRAAELAHGKARIDAEYHLALAAERLPATQRDTILPDLLRQLGQHSGSSGDLGSRIKALADRYKAQGGTRETAR